MDGVFFVPSEFATTLRVVELFLQHTVIKIKNYRKLHVACRKPFKKLLVERHIRRIEV